MIVDQADVYLMQNWDHLLVLFLSLFLSLPISASNPPTHTHYSTCSPTFTSSPETPMELTSLEFECGHSMAGPTSTDKPSSLAASPLRRSILSSTHTVRVSFVYSIQFLSQVTCIWLGGFVSEESSVRTSRHNPELYRCSVSLLGMD